jgi:1,5-anhydro-D-fructose reductase (1,5-anhydro-D-mannitol-forming)
MSTAKPLRWALVGASDIAGTRMIPALRAAEHEIVALHSGSQARGEAFATAHSIPIVARTLDELFGADVNAVYVSTRNDMHRHHAEAAATAGKHVLCEKPLATSVSDARAIVRTCAEAGVVLATNHHQRNAATVRTMARLVTEGAIGQPLSARVQHAILLPERLRGWRLAASDAGAGVILDITSHDVDTLRFVLRREALEAVGLSARQGLAAAGVEDAAMCVFRFEDDVIATTYDAFTVPSAGTVMDIHGTEGSLYGRDILTQDPIGEITLRHQSECTVVDVGEREDLYVRGILDFTAAVAGESAPIATGEDGLRALATAAAALEATLTGRRVAVPIFETGVSVATS